jgi:hypothetical protein
VHKNSRQLGYVRQKQMTAEAWEEIKKKKSEELKLLKSLEPVKTPNLER